MADRAHRERTDIFTITKNGQRIGNFFNFAHAV
jgi:hypothetical protein